MVCGSCFCAIESGGVSGGDDMVVFVANVVAHQTRKPMPATNHG